MTALFSTAFYAFIRVIYQFTTSVGSLEQSRPNFASVITNQAMKSYTFSLGFILACCHSLSAQSLRVSYFGETITHYGLRVAYERPFISYVKEQNSAKKLFFASFGTALYRHPQNHIGLVISPEVGYRRIGKRGGFFEVTAAPAYFRYFLDGTTYEVTESGDFRRVRMAGGNAFLPTVSVGLGRDLSVKRDLPLSWYIRLNLMQQRPYNTSSLLRFSLEAGTFISLKKP
ncbi:hypothetical protein GCM10027341_50710 [Spirosoma knui]